MKLYKPAFRKARIEIIPMIDTIFFLLVYFMFQTLVMVKMQALEVSIPKTSPQNNSIPPPRCVVKVDSAGNYYVNGKVVDPTGITDEVQTAVDKNPNTLVIISVDPNQPVQPLINCMDAVNYAHKPGPCTSPDGCPVNTIINGQGGVNLGV
jgi:biopolymer transport protein ExbD